jgi:hypothetical protein
MPDEIYRVAFTVDTGKTPCTYYTPAVQCPWAAMANMVELLEDTDGVLKAWVEEQEINWTKVP